MVSNSNISRIYNNYLHSLSTLIPWKSKTINSLEDEIKFTNVLAELVETHANTIPTLARGFLECKRYISPAEVTRFLDEHLRARIGTRLIAEQHIALHVSSQPHSESADNDHYQGSSYVGVIDTALKPATIIDSCGAFVSEICELKYGVRPTWIIDGNKDMRIAHIPVHLEYIVTELLKNAFRAIIESGQEKEPVIITIAAEPCEVNGFNTSMSSPGVTIRFRDRGGGIPADIVKDIWNYSFSTFSEHEREGNGNMHALNVISSSNGGSSIAGLGYGLPLGRAYAEHFGGGIELQSLFGWGCDVYLRLRGLGRLEL